ncbi:uncharacterized protein LOC131166185 [Malania oleifera]|uniref:uncharacterized protein LOC131166185 n=1 Tax=Malania oleifera TaxID=397392 RepID=UPI0025AD9F55|nr:uncharacterized protein LOC131166185 [Malania oleifera]
MEPHLLEINLISAQGLKTANARRMQTYAVAWVDSATRLRTRIDRVGGENPTWNDKFIFRVTDEFLASDTSAITVEIYAVGYIRDSLVGNVRFLINNCLADAGAGTPACTAVQIRRPSGRFHGVLNIGVMVINASDFGALTKASAIGYRDLMGESRRRRSFSRRRTRSEQFLSMESLDNISCADSADYSDGADSSTSSSSSASTALKEWNGIRENMKSDRLGLLCGLPLQRKIHLSPSDQNFQCFDDAAPENKQS